jgi:hypothetical protein
LGTLDIFETNIEMTDGNLVEERSLMWALQSLWSQTLALPISVTSTTLTQSQLPHLYSGTKHFSRMKCENTAKFSTVHLGRQTLLNHPLSNSPAKLGVTLT